MEIHRSHPVTAFTIIPDVTLRDPRLSYLARGVLAEILTRPDDWATTADALWRRARRERGTAGEGRKAVRKAFAELAAAGYLHRERRWPGRGRVVTVLHVYDSPDGLEAWLAAEAFRAAVDNLPPPDVSAGRTDDGNGSDDVSAGRTDDQTSSRRSDLRKPAFPQVAPTYRSPAPRPTGTPADRHPGRGHVSTETDDGDLGTETMNGNRVDENHTRPLTSPVPVERAHARSGQRPDIRHGSPMTREETAAEARRQADALTEWIRQHPDPSQP